MTRNRALSLLILFLSGYCVAHAITSAGSNPSQAVLALGAAGTVGAYLAGVVFRW